MIAKSYLMGALILGCGLALASSHAKGQSDPFADAQILDREALDFFVGLSASGTVDDRDRKQDTDELGKGTKAPGPVSIGIPAQPGPVDETALGSDQFLWLKLTEFAAPYDPGQRNPVVFETWASDLDTFNVTPTWPHPNAPKQFQISALQDHRNPGFAPVDEKCTAPPGAAVGGFPSTGCIAEETKRNKPQFEYIVANKLNTRDGLKAAYAANFDVQMPTDALATKGDWVPVDDLLEWIPELSDVGTIRREYYTNTSEGVEYALVSLHVSSRQNPNWVWGTFEHEKNPGRCDFIGCRDSFGAEISAIEPNLREKNSQYGDCEKSEELTQIMQASGLDPAWENYCLKSSMVDYTAPDGTPYVLGNSVVEGIVGNGTVAASSCIGCHVYASFDASGGVSPAAENMLPYNATGRPLKRPLSESLQYDFMWGVIKAP